MKLKVSTTLIVTVKPAADDKFNDYFVSFDNGYSPQGHGYTLEVALAELLVQCDNLYQKALDMLATQDLTYWQDRKDFLDSIGNFDD